jgi:hypothetical protein
LPKHIQFIFGLGSGRCGTGSLAKLLDKQPGIWAQHEGEFCPWEKELVAFYQSLIRLVSKSTEMRIANVAFYWKNYLSEIFRDLNDPKIIVLQRKREEVIESFASMYHGKNHWSDPFGKNFDGKNPGITPLGAMWPKYDLSKKDAIGQYWDEYYQGIDFWMNKFPENMIIVQMKDLFHKEETQREILRFLEIPESEMVIDTEIWEHKRREQKGGILTLYREPPKEFGEMAKNKALYGQAARYAGLPTEFEFELTDEEMAELQKSSEVQKLINEQAEF